MQVDDYIIQQRYKNDHRYMLILKVLDMHKDGYLSVEPQAQYNTVTKSYNEHPSNRNTNYITRARIKPYQPTLEELFIFKQIEENPNGTYTLQ
jgi:hypothetical protein